MKYNKETLAEYCDENHVEIINEYTTINRDTKIEGKCLTKDCTYLFNKSFRAIENGALCKECSIKSGTIKTRHFYTFLHFNRRLLTI